MVDLYSKVKEAAEKVRPFVRRTFVAESSYLGVSSGSSVFYKLENLQITGSFKPRGVFSKLLSMDESGRAVGLVTASTGNHGAAFAYAVSRLGLNGTVFVPKGSDPSKVKLIERFGGDVRFHGEDAVEAERYAAEYAASKGMIYLSPYNDLDVIAGHGTIALELLEQVDRLDAIFVALGSGGLISGIAGYAKGVNPDIEIVGCSPANSPVMMRSIEAGRIVDVPTKPTLSDGTAGGIEEDAVTFGLCRDLVDRFVTVSEEEIAAGIRTFLEREHMLIEGAAAVPIMSFVKLRDEYRSKHVAIIVCGANIAYETLRRVVCKG